MLFPRHNTAPLIRKPAKLIQRACRLACEPLERRMMLCAIDIHDDPRLIEPVYDSMKDADVPRGDGRAGDGRAGDGRAGDGRAGGGVDIIWVNRGVTSGAQNDRFNDVFGTNANAARSVVDAVIDAWERVISSFNYAGGAANAYTLTVKMDSAGASLGGVGSVGHYNNGKPDIGFVTLGRGIDTNGDGIGDGSGWFLDPTPNENSEFTGNITNAYAGDAPSAGPAFGLSDLYTVAAAEMTHCMGIIGGSNDFQNSGYLSSTTTTDTAEGGGVGKFWTFIGPSIKHLMTSNNGGPPGNGGVDVGVPIHTAGPGVPVGIVGEGVFIGAHDTGNAVYETGRRYLVSNTTRLILDDAYGYSTVNPEEFGTFYAVLNESTGQVTVRGGDDDSADNIDVYLDGGDVVIAVDVGDDVPGTGTEPGNGDINSFITRFPAADVDSILVDAGNGPDVINLWECESPVTVNGGFGNDTINVADGDIDTDLQFNVEVNGGGDSDRVIFDDRMDNPNSDVYQLGSTQLVKGPNGTNRRVTFSAMESLVLNGSDQPSRYDVLSVGVGMPCTINGGIGDETFNIADGDLDLDLGANVSISGGGGTDSIIVRDIADGPGGDTYQLSATALTKAATTINRKVFFNTIESLLLNGSDQPSSYDVSAVAANLPVTINGGDGPDEFDIAHGDIDANLASNVTVNGNGGQDDLNFNDQSDDAGDDTYTISQLVFSKAARDIRYGTVETIHLVGSPQDDTLQLNGSLASTPITLNSGAGSDTFVLGNNDLSSIQSAFILEGGSGHNALAINDATDAGDDTYTLTNNTFSKATPGGPTRLLAQYAAANEIVLLANPDANTINVQSTDVPVTILGGNGDDTFNIGLNGNVDGILGDVQTSGMNGTDRLNYNDGTSTTGRTYVVEANNLTRTGVANVIPDVDEVVVNCGDGADIINLKGNDVPVTVNGQQGDDRFIAGDGDWDLNHLADITLNGGAGLDDSLVINDAADAALPADGYTVEDTLTTKSSSNAAIHYATIEQYTLSANPGDNTIAINSSFAGPFRIRANGGADLINLVDNATGSVVTLDGGSGLDRVNVNSDAVGSAAARFESTQDLASLIVRAGGTATVSAGGSNLLVTQALAVGPQGVLDLSDNDLILDYASASALAAIQGLINAARSGGTWLGSGMTSASAGGNPNHNTTLGAMEASEFKSIYGSTATFDGTAIDTTAVLVKYTYYGDADFNGAVNFDDYVRTDSGFNNHKTGWLNGDFDGNGAVNFDDYVLIDLAFNTQSGAL